MGMPFITRTVILYILGTEYLGLSSLFSSLLSFLSLAELGVSNALVYSMYKPIAEEDEETVCALLALYRKLYRMIGLVILTAGLICVPFLRHFISGEVPADVNLYVLYGLYLSNTVCSYFLFAYRGSLLTAHQRIDARQSFGGKDLLFVAQPAKAEHQQHREHHFQNGKHHGKSPHIQNETVERKPEGMPLAF
jgi:hypothetical protein